MAETEDVGGPEEMIDRVGVVNSVCGALNVAGLARSCSVAVAGYSRDDVRRGIRLLGPGPYMEGEDLEDREGKAHEDDCEAWKGGLEDGEWLLRSASRSCKACDGTSGTSDSSGADMLNSSPAVSAVLIQESASVTSMAEREDAASF